MTAIDHETKETISCPSCQLTIIDNSSGKYPCSFCGKLNLPPPLALDMSEAADSDPDADGYRRAASSGLMLADFECRHGIIGPCRDCETP